MLQFDVERGGEDLLTRFEAGSTIITPLSNHGPCSTCHVRSTSATLARLAMRCTRPATDLRLSSWLASLPTRGMSLRKGDIVSWWIFVTGCSTFVSSAAAV